MCTRYFIEPEAVFQEMFGDVRSSALTLRMANAFSRQLKTSGEVFPTDIAPVIAPDRHGESAVFPMVFGYSLPRSKGPLLNARVETAGEKPTFREGWEKHRCIIPASYYFEWEHLVLPSDQKKTDQKYMIQPSGDTETWLCGLYRIEDGFPHFVILTREPGEELKWLHDRMPVILPKECVREWIRPDGKPEYLLEKMLTDMRWEKSA